MTTLFFFFNDTATTEIYTLSLHDALPIFIFLSNILPVVLTGIRSVRIFVMKFTWIIILLLQAMILFIVSPSRKRSEEHTSELQSRQYLVCRLLLEKKKKETFTIYIHLRIP